MLLLSDIPGTLFARLLLSASRSGTTLSRWLGNTGNKTFSSLHAIFVQMTENIDTCCCHNPLFFSAPKQILNVVGFHCILYFKWCVRKICRTSMFKHVLKVSKLIMIPHFPRNCTLPLLKSIFWTRSESYSQKPSFLYGLNTTLTFTSELVSNSECFGGASSKLSCKSGCIHSSDLFILRYTRASSPLWEIRTMHRAADMPESTWAWGKHHRHAFYRKWHLTQEFCEK